MSIALMTLVWRIDIAPTDKLVLLALADAANDEGVTWMALKSRRQDKMDLLMKCSLSQRAIQMSLRRLEAGGLINRCEKPGRGVIYTVFPGGAHDMHPPYDRGAPDAPGGARRAGGGAPDAPKPSIKHQLTLIPSGEAPVEKPSRRKPSKPIPESFPDEPCLTWAREEAAKTDRNLSVVREAERFRNHAQQHDRRCSDWAAAWRNWVDKAIERAPSLGIAFSPTPAPDTSDPWPDRIREWQRSGDWKSGDWGPPPDSPKTEVAARYLTEVRGPSASARGV
jgi:DNA-binding transcriptional ArsR family regulator